MQEHTTEGSKSATNQLRDGETDRASNRAKRERNRETDGNDRASNRPMQERHQSTEQLRDGATVQPRDQS